MERTKYSCFDYHQLILICDRDTFLTCIRRLMAKAETTISNILKTRSDIGQAKKDEIVFMATTYAKLQNFASFSLLYEVSNLHYALNKTSDDCLYYLHTFMYSLQLTVGAIELHPKLYDKMRKLASADEMPILMMRKTDVIEELDAKIKQIEQERQDLTEAIKILDSISITHTKILSPYETKSLIGKVKRANDIILYLISENAQLRAST